MFRVIYEDGIESTLDDGGESVYVQGTNDTLQGGLGADWISTVLRASSYDDSLATALSGGKGADTLQAVLTHEADFGASVPDPDAPHLAATLDGGSGDDEISVRVASRIANQEVTIEGGTGADSITVISDVFGRGVYRLDTHDAGIFINAGSGADAVSASAATGGIEIRGGSGNDQLEANAGALSETDGGSTKLYGGSGNDSLTASAIGGDFGGSYNLARGGSGSDMMELFAGGASAENVAYGDEGNDTLRLEASAFRGASNLAYGGDGNDIFRLVARATSWNDGGEASNEAHGGDGTDVIAAVIDLPDGNNSEGETEHPLSGHNLIYGDAGDDRISGRIDTPDPSGGAFFSELYGGSGNDRLSVRGGDGNILNGGAGDDVLLGGAGSDTLIGLQGDDYLRGRGGEDTFLFGYIRNGEQDRIADFTIGEDKIDLSQIDANRDRGGEQSFRFGTREGTGRVWVEESKGSSSILHADDGHRVLEVVLQDGRGIDAGDYHASDFLL